MNTDKTTPSALSEIDPTKPLENINIGSSAMPGTVQSGLVQSSDPVSGVEAGPAVADTGGPHDGDAKPEVDVTPVTRGRNTEDELRRQDEVRRGERARAGLPDDTEERRAARQREYAENRAAKEKAFGRRPASD